MFWVVPDPSAGRTQHYWRMIGRVGGRGAFVSGRRATPLSFWWWAARRYLRFPRCAWCGRRRSTGTAGNMGIPSHVKCTHGHCWVGYDTNTHQVGGRITPVQLRTAVFWCGCCYWEKKSISTISSREEVATLKGTSSHWDVWMPYNTYWAFIRFSQRPTRY